CCFTNSYTYRIHGFNCGSSLPNNGALNCFLFLINLNLKRNSNSQQLAVLLCAILKDSISHLKPKLWNWMCLFCRNASAISSHLYRTLRNSHFFCSFPPTMHHLCKISPYLKVLKEQRSG